MINMRGKLLKAFNFCRGRFVFSSMPLEPGSIRKSSVAHLLKSKIKMTGPISVYDYMKEVLTNPESGYYMTKDVFGKSGDFITSPEISQMFGEMIAVWTLNEWQKLGAPKQFQLVELGPGRGTMMNDILRVYNRLKFLSSDVSVHMVEISEELSMIQAKKLCKTIKKTESNYAYYMSGLTDNNIKVYWHSSIKDVPNKFSCFLAHEFFDALPVHILKKSEDRGWLEVLVDIDQSSDNKFRFVLSNSPTPACIYAKYANGRDYFEFSPQSGVVMEMLAERLEMFGGFALVVDYGHVGTKGDTFRGFRKHMVVDPLENPGSSDLTADVDFAFLKTIGREKLISFGPVSQQNFFKQLHIDVRLQVKTCH